MKVLIPAGSQIEIQGLFVSLVADTEIELGDITTDQAAELAVAHKLPVDINQFSHFDEEKSVSVRYSKFDGARIETLPEAVVEDEGDPTEKVVDEVVVEGGVEDAEDPEAVEEVVVDEDPNNDPNDPSARTR